MRPNTQWLTVEETPAMRMGSMSVVVVFSSFLLFFSGGPGGLSPPEGRFPPPAPDIFASLQEKKNDMRYFLWHIIAKQYIRLKMEISFIWWQLMLAMLQAQGH